jgi:hypothetical protein
MTIPVKCDSDLPIACKLSDPEFQERREGLLREVGAAMLEQRELDSGYAYRFPADAHWINELSKLITAERDCCPFLRFTLNVEPGDGPIWLELTGPAGTKDFLKSLFV